MPQHHFLRDLLVTYAAALTLQTIPRIRLRNGLKSNGMIIFRKGNHPDVSRHALFLVLLPRVHAILKRSYPKSNLPVALSSALIYLVKPYYRRTIVIYAAVAAVLNYKRDAPIRKKLPPIWALNVVGNAWLLWTFLFITSSFPGGYGEVILRHSGYGLPGESKQDLVKFLSSMKFEVYPTGTLSSLNSKDNKVEVHPAHTREFCAHVHPNDPSCLRTYLKAWVSQCPRVFQWVAAFGLIPIFIRKSPLNLNTFKQWIINALRGTTFVVGSINTTWGLACLSQRILPPRLLPRHRWILNGFFGSFWILILPKNRRNDFSLYTARLGLISLWDVLDDYTPRMMEALIFAVSWSSLLRDRQAGKGPKGLTSSVLNYVESQV